MRQYELMYIVRPQIEGDDLIALYERVGQWIANLGGKLEDTNVWGRRTLAYPIKRHSEGTYILQHFQLAPKQLGELERNLKLNEDVIRYLVTVKGEVDEPVSS